MQCKEEGHCVAGDANDDDARQPIVRHGGSDSTDDDDERSNDLPRVFRHDHAYVGEVAADEHDDRQHHEGGEDDRHVHLQGTTLRGSGGVQRELAQAVDDGVVGLVC